MAAQKFQKVANVIHYITVVQLLLAIETVAMGVRQMFDNFIVN